MTGFTEIQSKHVTRGKYYSVGIMAYTFAVWQISQNATVLSIPLKEIASAYFLLLVVVPLFYVGFNIWQNSNIDRAYSNDE